MRRTEYWVSQARHWCEYCRIFIGGSKQSIAFHENGKKHKEIVALSLKDMRRRGRERKKEQSELERELAQIERAANKEYMAKDYDRNKRIALKQNPMSAKLLLDPATIDDYEEVVEISLGR